MINATSPEDQFKSTIRAVFQRNACIVRVIRVMKNRRVYMTGDRDSAVYLVETGQIKALVHSADGKDCLIGIYTPGEIFGELCLGGQSVRMETAEAMQDSVLRVMSCRNFMTQLSRDLLMDGLVHYLASRVLEHQRTISELLTMNSEQRLATVLLQLAGKFGGRTSWNRRMACRILYRELAEIVGTTRTRIGSFMKKFQELGLIESAAAHGFIIREAELAQYLEAQLTDCLRPGAEWGDDTQHKELTASERSPA